ncbi:hypothetical protein Rleg4DRAFT_6949 [Rhizobium leguminosarum bv. trifolii WSM2297]|uniref:ABM domain-containing protein n=2 Tax=Rhizobium leguminosarum TaxID=384 RepID=J0WGE7_RHILT|nr:hypothetical protein Rleg4DRAFT_5072 [Rhizobium leguminosarum bv. trifolii WSM2297]EJC85086.1 hypothetical protein Rleg4DRAFT_6949 [Rhizobium leguminosarum bv. trifolii WSM2297]
MSIKILVQFKALAEKQVAFHAIMESVKTDLPKAPGCLSATVMQAAGNPCQYALVETWDSEARHKAHVQGLLSNGAWAKIESHLDGQPISAYFREIS